MNKQKFFANHFGRLFPNFATISGKSPLCKQFSFLLIAAVVTISTAITARGACQTPQFALPVVLNVTRPVAVAPGDFNGDGNIDLAVLKDLAGAPFRGTIELFLGNGSSFASTGLQYNALQGNVIYDLAAADFNRDGKLDLVAVGGSQSFAAILLGNGNGGFGAPTNFQTGGNVGAVATADFNNDGNVDIVTRGFSSASVLPGLGNGSFNAPIIVSTGSGSSNSIAVRDFNNDGFLDFATVNTSGSDSSLSIKLGNGSFIFTSPPTINVPGPYNLTSDDFNRDGKQDLAVVNYYPENVSVLLGAGNGSFNSPVGSPFPTGGDFSQYIAAADLNNDNYPDLAVGNASQSNSLSILLNNRAGGFGAPFNLSPEQNETERIYQLDYDRNRAIDLVLVKYISENKVVLLRNTCAPANRPQFDFDGDGKADIAVFRPSNGVWYLLNSASGFTGQQFGISTDKPVPADYDGDGKTDVAVFRDGNWYRINSSTNQFTGFQWGVAGDIPVPGDYDGDGKADLAVFRSGNWYILQSSNNQFRAVQFGISTDVPVQADFDGDGKIDIAVFRDGVWYWLQSSDGGFRGLQFGVAGDKPTPADFDGDGKTDQAVFRSGVWYLQRSSQGFTGQQFGIASDVPTPADYDGDGKTDIAVFRAGNWYLLNSSNQMFQAAQFGLSTDKPIESAFVP